MLDSEYHNVLIYLAEVTIEFQSILKKTSEKQQFYSGDFCVLCIHPVTVNPNVLLIFASRLY